MKIIKTWWYYLDYILAVVGIAATLFVIYKITSWFYFIIN